MKTLDIEHKIHQLAKMKNCPSFGGRHATLMWELECQISLSKREEGIFGSAAFWFVVAGQDAVSDAELKSVRSAIRKGLSLNSRLRKIMKRTASAAGCVWAANSHAQY